MGHSVKIKNQLAVINVIFVIILMQASHRLFAEIENDNPTTVIKAINCMETHDKFMSPILGMGLNESMNRGVVIRAKYLLQKNTTLEVTEQPRTHSGDDIYNSMIVVNRANKTKEYVLAQLIKRGGYFRLWQASSFCSMSGHGFLILAFQAVGASGWEAYVLVRWSHSRIDVNAFPTVSQGKIVVDRADAKDYELWSAIDADMTDCTACPKHYEIQDCQLDGDSIRCKMRKRTIGPLSPKDMKGKEITFK